VTGSAVLRVFRYAPGQARASGYEKFRVPVGAQTTVLDALAWVQTTEDPTLAFRYACRVGMCGSCAMVVNGRERWTCRTRLRDLGSETVTVRPLYHFPLVKDLVVDMAPFRARMERVGATYVPSEGPAAFAPIPAGSAERSAIDPAIECIGCGACLSACTMVGWRPEFPGPAALLRAFTLVEDSRDARRDRRFAGLLSEDALWHCHTQFNCAAVCPMGLSPTEAIGRLKRQAMAAWLVRRPSSHADVESRAAPRPAPELDVPRRRLMHGAALALAAAVAVPLAGLLGAGVLGRRERDRQWVRLGPVSDLPSGRPKEVHYEVPTRERGRKRLVPERAYLVRTSDGLVAFDPQCTHLGCATRWDEATSLFLCPCHGGGYDLGGRVVMGPPPRPLRRLEVSVEGDDLYIRSG
jgi:succinate dehydrogenase / fumarate reductase iron-sulfur subunit